METRKSEDLQENLRHKTLLQFRNTLIQKGWQNILQQNGEIDNVGFILVQTSLSACHFATQMNSFLPTVYSVQFLLLHHHCHPKWQQSYS